MKHLKTEFIDPSSNVRITVRDRAGKVVDTQKNHNIFTNTGREWLASLVAGDAVFGNAHPQIVSHMGFGTGGALQDVPSLRGPQTENAAVTALERLEDLKVTDEDLAFVTHTKPTITTTRFTRVVTLTDLTFGAITGVALSEAGLFAVDAAASSIGVDAELAFASPTPFLVAYQQFRTITKTDQISIQFDWELRF